MKTQVFENRRFEYMRLLELGLIISLSSLILILQGNKRFIYEPKTYFEHFPEIDLTNIPQTAIEKKIAPPRPPSIPIPSEIENDIKGYDIDEIIRDWDNISNSLPSQIVKDEDVDELQIYVVFEKPPQPIGGMKAIRDHLDYPEIARLAGIEGRVTVMAYIDEKGRVFRTEILQSLGPNGCDEAAIRAVNAVQWEPAMQRDRPVRVKIAIPIDFKLSDG